MTYCLAIRLEEGLVFCSDSRTNAGADRVSTYSKMHRFAVFEVSMLGGLERDLVHGGAASMKGSWIGIPVLVRAAALLVVCVGVICPVKPALAASVPAAVGSDQQDTEADLERLRGMLDESGPEGKAKRVSAVQQLLALPKREAHRLLHERLLRSKDPDGLRLTILESLGVHLLGNRATQFGGADETLRRVILTGYLDACAPLWRDAPDVEDVAGQPIRVAAREALRRVPVRELDAAARTLMGRNQPADRVLVLRCLADMQQTLLAKTIADQLDSPEDVVRFGAQDALQLLTYASKPIRSKADFEAWFASYGEMPYVDLVELAARILLRALQLLALTVSKERPDLEEQKAEIIQSNNDNKIKV